MEATLSPLRNADGSCELKWGPQTRILCGVTGPGDISSSKRLFDRANLFFSINRIHQKSKEGFEKNFECFKNFEWFKNRFKNFELFNNWFKISNGSKTGLKILNDSKPVYFCF
jgi:hypothetical protein